MQVVISCRAPKLLQLLIDRRIVGKIVRRIQNLGLVGRLGLHLLVDDLLS